jgi:hypothetical protein
MSVSYFLYCNECYFVDLIMVNKGNMFLLSVELTENNDRRNQPIRKCLTSKGLIRSKLTRDYDETRLTNSSNVLSLVSLCITEVCNNNLSANPLLDNHPHRGVRRGCWATASDSVVLGRQGQG